jgi:hypothetical protein
MELEIEGQPAPCGGWTSRGCAGSSTLNPAFRTSASAAHRPPADSPGPHPLPHLPGDHEVALCRVVDHAMLAGAGEPLRPLYTAYLKAGGFL